MNIQKIGPQTKEVLTLARERHMGFRVLGEAGVLSGETYKEGWWLTPMDDSTQFPEASKRIEGIMQRGVPVEQVLLAHEAPRLLCAPKIQKKPLQAPQVDWEEVGKIGKVVGTLLAVFTAGAAALLSGTGLLLVLGLAALIDPAIIAVIADTDGNGNKTYIWVEVLRWYE